ncbi:MAG: PAS domain S-box protein [Lentisphaeria bacterium]|nr:PAS domain S-box protein [Lentisphaeria bacterium]
MITIQDLKDEKDIPVIFANSYGIISGFNEQFLKVYKWKKENLLGEPLTNIMPENYRDAHHLGFAKFIQTQTSTILNHPLELEVEYGDGTSQIAEHILVAEKIDGEWVVGGQIKPL